MKPELSIVIVGYNTRQLLLDCLASIYRTSLSLECIVIDNASSDCSVDVVRTRYPQVQQVANQQNVYYSAANNQGIARANGRYVLVMNPDMTVQGDTLAQLVRQMDADPTIGAATTSTVFPGGRIQRNGSRFVTFGYLLFNYTVIGKLFPVRRRVYNDWLWYRDWDRTTPHDIDILPGCCIIASKDTWAAVGGFDARMLHYFSDDYFSRAVQRLGKRTMYLISDGIVHYEGESAHRVKVRTLRLYMHDLLVYTRRVFGYPAAILLFFLIIPTWIVLGLKARKQQLIQSASTTIRKPNG